MFLYSSRGRFNNARRWISSLSIENGVLIDPAQTRIPIVQVIHVDLVHVLVLASLSFSPRSPAAGSDVGGR